MAGAAAASGVGAAVGNKVERGHEMYREGRYKEALGLYSNALLVTKTTPQRIALHSNRAACFLKLHLFKQAADECTFVLELDHNHTGALMLRAQTLLTLHDYHSALFDVNRLLELNPSSQVYLNLQARLKTQLSLATIPEAEEEVEEDEDISEGVEESEDNTVNIDNRKPEESGVNGCENNTSTSSVSSDTGDNGWGTIPKPIGHSRLDYSRWDKVESNSSDDDDDSDEDDEETQPQYRFRVKTVDVRRVK